MKNCSNESSKALDSTYGNSNKFVVIGLTGRTGSGCSTTARILTQDKVDLPSSATDILTKNESRKYQVIKKYTERNWKQFEWLQVRSVITSYLLEIKFNELIELIAKHTQIKPSEIEAAISDIRPAHEEYSELLQKLEDSSNTAVTGFSSFYLKTLPKFSDSLKGALQKLGQNTYISFFQYIGDNIRSSNSAASSEFTAEHSLQFAARIHSWICLIRDEKIADQGYCYLVIDAIRNPYEASYLRSKLPYFFLIAINTSNENRLKHLQESQNFSPLQIEELDKKEYPEKLKGDKRFTSQNIQKCIEISDIHIHNPRWEKFDERKLKIQICWYVALIQHPGLVMPTSVENCMQIAYSAKKSSGCISRQVGAAITDRSFSIKAIGWNNTPQGQVPCLLRSTDGLLSGDDPSAYSGYERKNEKFREHLDKKFSDTFELADKRGLNLSFCFKDVQNEIEQEKNQVHTRSLHAEENAFLQIAKFGGQPIKGGILFTTASPCELCAKKAYQLGISEIFYIDPYPGIATNHILSSGSAKPKMTLFTGAVGKAFHTLYQPLMPFKDELEILLPVRQWENRKDVEIRDLKAQVADLKNELRIAKNASLETVP